MRVVKDTDDINKVEQSNPLHDVQEDSINSKTESRPLAKVMDKRATERLRKIKRALDNLKEEEE